MNIVGPPHSARSRHGLLWRLSFLDTTLWAVLSSIKEAPALLTSDADSKFNGWTAFGSLIGWMGQLATPDRQAAYTHQGTPTRCGHNGFIESGVEPTHHFALKCLNTGKDLMGELARWSLKEQACNMERRGDIV